MREALRHLTIRGRAFAAAGATALVCAVLLGQPGLTRVAVLLLVLPFLVAFAVGRGRYRLELTRTVSPRVVAPGQPARVHLSLGNDGHVPGTTLLLEERVPFALGARPRFTVRNLGQGAQLEYHVRADQRGRFEIGPMTVRVCDPFGLVQMGRAFNSTAALTVTPRTVPLDPISLTGMRNGTGDSRPRAFAGGSAEDVTVREYRRGDDLRRVHWRSSARVGELMVRREEQPWQARATLLLDTRERAHRGTGPTSSFEVAVSAAASIALHLTQRGFSLRLVTATGEDPTTWQQRHDGSDAAAMMEALAIVTTTRTTGFDVGWLGTATGDGLTVAILGALDGTEAASLRRIRHHAGAAFAIALEVGGWGAPGPGQIHTPVLPTAVLGEQGWRAAPLARGDRLEQAWSQLGSRAGTTMAGLS